jgi:hypothetical protein
MSRTKQFDGFDPLNDLRASRLTAGKYTIRDD